MYSGYLVGARGTIIKASDTAAFVPQITAGPEALRINPNPASQAAVIGCKMSDAGNVTMRLSDIPGRILKAQDFGWQAAGFHEFPVKLEGLAPGVYFIRLDAGKQRFAGKLLVE